MEMLSVVITVKLCIKSKSSIMSLGSEENVVYMLIDRETLIYMLIETINIGNFTFN
jgi:hypothetical protein